MGRAGLFQFFKHDALGIEILKHGFDDQIGIGGTLQSGIQSQAGQSGVAGALGHAAFFHIAEHSLFNSGLCALQSFQALVVQSDGVAAADGVLGNAAAHQAGADNKNLLNSHT